MTQLRYLLEKTLKQKKPLQKTSISIPLKTKVEETIVRDANGEFKTYEYFIEGTLSNTNVDFTGRKFSKSALEYMAPKFIGLKGDLSHINLRRERNARGWRELMKKIPTDKKVFEVIDSSVVDDNLVIKARIDSNIPEFPDVWNMISDREFLDFSIEALPITYDENTCTYTKAEPIGFSVVDIGGTPGTHISRLAKT